jgi:amidase
MSELFNLTLSALSARLAAGDASPVEATRAMLDRIAARDGNLHSYVHVTASVAMDAAHAAEREIAAGRRRGPLHGVPLAVKDLFWTADAPTAGGTAILHDHRPSADATVVRRLREAGAILLGKLQMTEGAYSDHHPSVTAPQNPWNADYWTGISSSGSGVAVAAGLCFGALASDTGGSIRWPSAACGVTGLKPSWGRVSRHGTLELAASLDHIGVMARSAADAGLLLAAIAGPDPFDPTAVVDPVPDLAFAASDLAGITVGIDPSWNGEDVDDEVQVAVTGAATTLQGLGATLVEVEVPEVTDAIADWPANCAVEAAVAHEATFPARAAEYGPVLTAVLECGLKLSGIDYQKILLRRMALRGAVDRLLAGIDLLLCPVQPFAPITLETLGTMGERPDLIARLQRYTCVFDMTGSPALTLPGGFDGAGLPIGVQLVAGRLREDLLVRAGIAYQGATDWHERRPHV